MKDIEDKGYICLDCALSYGCTWPKDHCSTWHTDDCPYCGEVKALCSTGDWDWPDKKARGMRD